MAFHECFVSSTDAMIGGQAGRTSESIVFTSESPAVCCFGDVQSTLSIEICIQAGPIKRVESPAIRCLGL